MKCSNCHVENIQSAIYCVHCGHKLAPPVQEQKPCSSCGAVNLPQAVFCVRCGNKIQDQTNTVQPQQKEEATPDTKLEEQVELEGLKSESAQKHLLKGRLFACSTGTMTEDVLSSDKPPDAQPEVTLLSVWMKHPNKTPGSKSEYHRRNLQYPPTKPSRERIFH